MTEPSPAPEHDAAEERVHTPAPTPDTEDKEPKKTTKKKDFPVGQVAAGGLGAVTLGSYALASVVGPAGWLAAPAAGAVAGAGYVAYRHRKSRSGMERTKTTITRTRGSKMMRGGGLSGLRSRGGGSRSGLGSGGRAGGLSTSAKRSGGLTTPGRSGTGLGSSSVRKGSGMGAGSRGGAAARRTGGGTTPRTGSSGRRTPGGGGGGGLFSRGGSSPRSGGSGGGLLGRGAAPRSTKGGTTPRGGSSSRRSGGGLLGRGSDTTSSKRKSTPPGGGSSPKTGGSMPKNRWGGASGPTSRSTRGGRIRRGAARARDWADDKTGRRMSTGWKAARGQKGFKARRRAAGQAVREAGGGGILAALVGILAAIGGLFKSRKDEPTGDNVDQETTQKQDQANATKEKSQGAPQAPTGTFRPRTRAEAAANYAKGSGYKLGEEVPGHPGVYYADPRDDRPGYVDHGRTTGYYDANIDPRTWEERVAAGDVPGFNPKPTTASTTTPTGGTTMSGLPAAQIAHDMSAAMSRYEPADAYQIVPDSRQWVDVPHQVAMAVKAYADRLEGARFPINDAINDKLREFAQAMAATRAIAEEIEPLMRKAHADDLARKETPRGDESKWNI